MNVGMVLIGVLLILLAVPYGFSIVHFQNRVLKQSLDQGYAAFGIIIAISAGPALITLGLAGVRK